MNKNSIFFLPLLLCTAVICTTLNGMADKSVTANDGQISPHSPFTLEPLSTPRELTSRLRALEQYVVTLATIQADQARETERTDIQKKLNQIKRLQKDLHKKLHGKKLTTESDAQLRKFEALATEEVILQDKLHALDESI